MVELPSPLGQFFASYFHPDWYLDDDSSEAVVDRYVQVADIEQIQAVLQQLDCFIQDIGSLSSEEIERELLIIGAYHRCRVESRSARDWLRVVSAKLKAAVVQA